MDSDINIEVVGAGVLRVSKYDGCRCGGVIGYSIGVEWGSHGFAGGVMSREDAIKLALHILKTSAMDNYRDIQIDRLIDEKENR